MYIFNAIVEENDMGCIVHLYMVEVLAFGDYFAEKLFKSIVLMKRYINFTGGSENVGRWSQVASRWSLVASH